MSDITIYTKDDCPYCDQAKTLLRAKGAAYSEVDVTRDPSVKAEMIARSGRQTVPQIFIDDHHVGGYDDLAALENSGELDPLLGITLDPVDNVSHERLAIIGSGPAGFTAAIYAARAGLKPVLISGYQVGGQLTTTTDVDNWPGGAEGLQGPKLMHDMEAHAERAGVRIIRDFVTEVDLARRPFKLLGRKATIIAETLIIATGATARYLGLPSEDAYKGKGVSACATCDGFFFKDEDVAVVGGGNTAVEEALYLANIARHVTLIHRGDALKAEQVLQDRLFDLEAAGKVDILWNHEVVEVSGDGDAVHGLVLRNRSSGAKHAISVSGTFIAIGHDPNTALFAEQLELEDGYIATRGGHRGGATRTSVPGVFAAGDVADPVYMQAVTSSALGAMAALDAEKFLATA